MSANVTLEDVWKLFQETDRKMQETDRQMKETDRKMQETDRIIQENALQMKETDRIVKDVAKQVGNLSSRWGEFVEGLVAPACETLFANRGFDAHAVARRVKAKRPVNRHMEIDLLVTNATDTILVEVKSRLTTSDVREHIDRLAQFKDFFPIYSNMRIMGAVAGITVDDDAQGFAINQGLFVIVQSGETVTLANDNKFVPRTW